MKSVRLHPAIAISVVCLLAGCAALLDEIPDTLPPDHVPGATGQTGIVVGSVTSLPNRYGQWQEWSAYSFRARADSTVAGRLWSGSDDLYGRLIVPFAYRRYPEYKGCAEEASLESVCGRLFAIELPVGEYEIWQVIVAGRGGASSVWTVPLAETRFTVRGGAVTYLGNLNNRICVSSIGLSNIVVAVSGEVQDHFTRDWPLLIAKYPFIAEQSMERAVIQGQPWQQRLWSNREPSGGWEVCNPEAAEQDLAASPEF
jgi:hypothetical protein